MADLGGLTLGPGVHFDATSFEVNGILTLNGMGDPTAVWVFQMGTTLTTNSGSSILLINGAQASNVFWHVGSSATLGATSDFAGIILASESITLGTGAVIQGRALAYNGAGELSGNAVTVPVPEPGMSLLVGAALLETAGIRRRR